MDEGPLDRSGDALVIVDVQVDFCPGGALPINDGDRVVPVINTLIQKAIDQDRLIIASRDWHPEQHISFESEGGPWPRHCVQDTPGAAFHPNLSLPASAIIVTKGTRFDQDQNSAFDQTGLADFLKRKKIDRIVIGGLALDVCVLATTLDGRKTGLDAVLVLDATQPVNPLNAAEAIQRMRTSGVILQDL